MLAVVEQITFLQTYLFTFANLGGHVTKPEIVCMISRCNQQHLQGMLFNTNRPCGSPIYCIIVVHV